MIAIHRDGWRPRRPLTVGGRKAGHGRGGGKRHINARCGGSAAGCGHSLRVGGCARAHARRWKSRLFGILHVTRREELVVGERQWLLWDGSERRRYERYDKVGALWHEPARVEAKVLLR